MMSFSQLQAVKKDTIFGAARKIFSPSYFVMTLIAYCPNTYAVLHRLFFEELYCNFEIFTPHLSTLITVLFLHITLQMVNASGYCTSLVIEKNIF